MRLIICRDRSPRIYAEPCDYPRVPTLQRIQLYWRRWRESNGVRR